MNFLIFFKNSVLALFLQGSLKSLCDWLALSNPVFYWPRVSSSQNHFENTPQRTPNTWTLYPWKTRMEYSGHLMIALNFRVWICRRKWLNKVLKLIWHKIEWSLILSLLANIQEHSKSAHLHAQTKKNKIGNRLSRVPIYN